MIQRAIGPTLGVALALAVAGCAQPVRVNKTNAENTSTNIPGVTLANPRVGEASDGATPFPALPDGYRGLGGAFMNGGSLVVVSPDMDVPMAKDDLNVGLAHGMAAGHPAPVAIETPDCRGRGDAPDTAIEVPNLSDPADEVAAGIVCAKLRHPGAQWLMSQLITKGDGYLSQVALRDDGGDMIVVYTDVSRFADKLIDELGG